LPNYKLIEGQCGTCGWAAGFEYADGPSGPEDAVKCTSEGMADLLRSQDQGELTEMLESEGYMNLWRLEAMAEETHRCKHWKPKDTPKNQLVVLLRHLRGVVHDMSALYDNHPELNDDVDIQRVVAMSLDEWESEIPSVIESIEKGGE